MKNCILGGDNFRAFRVDLGGQNSEGDNFQHLLNSGRFNQEVHLIKLAYFPERSDPSIVKYSILISLQFPYLELK